MAAALEARTLVVPVDLSPDSFDSFLGAVAAIEHVPRIHVVHVVPSPIARGPRGELARHRRVTEGSRMLTELIRAWGIRHARPVILEGAIGPAVKRFAEAVSADAIVVPARRPADEQSFVLGPAAEKILHHASCPVFLMWSHARRAEVVAA